MTLADPAHVELAAWLPAAEAIDVAPGGKITLYPNASPTESYDAEIIRVAYKRKRWRAACSPTGCKPASSAATSRGWARWAPPAFMATGCR